MSLQLLKLSLSTGGEEVQADWYLFAHGVDSIGPQQRHCLLHQVGPSTVQHPEAQVLLELGFDGHCVQLPRSTKAVVRPEGEGEMVTWVQPLSPGSGPWDQTS